MTPNDRSRWIALYVLCLGMLMIVLDATIVGVALPSIKDDLGFTQSGLAWVVTAYLLTYGGCLLLGGRLGDLYGHRRLFLAGLAVFTLSSLLCGLATTPAMLIAARAVQGVGGAVTSAVSFGLVMTLFAEPADRAKAMGIAGFVASGGGSVGVLLGGVLTGALSWHWIFLVNIPIGVLVLALTLRLIPAAPGLVTRVRLDVGGAAAITAALMLAVLAIDTHPGGFGSASTAGLFAGAAALLVAFVAWERRSAAPLVPLRLFARRNLSVANAASVLWAAAMFAWFFMTALYLQLVLGYSPTRVGLAFLPGNLIMGALSVVVSARLVMRYGYRKPLGAGLTLAALGLALFARAPVHGRFLTDVLPGMVLLGVAAGIAFNPVLLAAMGDVEPHEAGVASGLVNTSFMMGGALGLAVLASVASSRAASLGNTVAALASGYHAAFAGGAVAAILGAALGVALLREPRGAPELLGEPALAEE